MQTPKKFSSFSDQVSWISDEKGIKIKDREYAEEMLRQIGYFPLMGGYKHLFRISNTKKYKVGTSFEEIVSLYKFDAELRELFFKYLLQIERQMRSLMSYYFTEMYGAEQKQYLDANNYNNTKRNHATIVKLIATLKRATTTTDYTYINYYRKTCVKTECLQEGWQTSGSLRIVRMAFNLYCNGTPSVGDYEAEEDQLKECQCYTVEDLFCCGYARYFWEAIKIRYPEYCFYKDWEDIYAEN